MSIESRLLAKKRSAQARRKAKVKSALELAVIILIPVAILVIVLMIYRNSLPQYSRYLDKEGNFKGYSISDNVKLADLDALDLKYDKYKPTDSDVDDAIVSALKTAVEQEKAKQEAAEKAGETTDDKTSEGSTSSNSTETDDADKTDAAAPSDGSTKTTGETTDTDGDTKTDAQKEKEEYLAMLTDENVEKYFATTLGTTYAHTANGYRQYTIDTLWKNNFDKKVETDIVEYLTKNSEVKEIPPKKVVKVWTRIVAEEMEEEYEYYKSLYTSLGLNFTASLYEYYDNREDADKGSKSSKEYFNEVVESYARSRLTEYVILQAAFDKLGFTYSESEVDAFIREHFVTDSKTIDQVRDEYGSEFLALSWKVEKVLDTLKARVEATKGQTATDNAAEQ